jgi:hypothetical protein
VARVPGAEPWGSQYVARYMVPWGSQYVAAGIMPAAAALQSCFECSLRSQEEILVGS